MLDGIDHVVVMVRDLDSAITDYRNLGFQVTAGGQHPGIAHNALIPFHDGSYLELFAFLEPESRNDHRWFPLLDSGGGLIDYALRTRDLNGALGRIRARGLAFEGPLSGCRERPDGETLSWWTGEPTGVPLGELPFLIEDVTPQLLRVPSGEAAKHPIGVTGLAAIVIAVRELGQPAESYAKLLGAIPPPIEIDEVLEAETMTYTIGAQRLVLACPSAPGSPIAAHLQQRGNSPYQVVLLAWGVGAAGSIEPAQAAGARIVIEPAG